MVVVAPTTPNLKATPNLRSQSNPRRPPLLPSERDNSNNSNVSITANNRRSKSRAVNSRYLSTSSSSSTSGSSSSTVSNSSYFSSSSRRCPSPIPSKTTNSSVPAIASMNSSAIKRSQSAERRRPSTPRARGERTHGEMSAAAKMLMSSSKSLSVSFQGGSFAVPPSGKKMVKNSLLPSPSPSPVASLRRGAPETKQSLSRTTPWPGRSRPPPSVSSLSRSVDLGGCEGRKSVNGPSNKVVRALQESITGDCKVNGSMSKNDIVKGVRDDNEGCVNGSSLGSESFVSDRESVSSESNSGSQDISNGEGVARRKGGSRIIVVPAKYWQEANSSQSKCVLEPGSPMARSSTLKGTVPPKLFPNKRLVSDNTGASPRAPVSNRGISSPLHGYGTPFSSGQSGASLHSPSPSKVGSSLRPASPCNTGAPLRSSSASKTGASLRPSSPSKTGVSLRPSSPSKTGVSFRPSSPSKTGASLRPSSPNKTGGSLRSASPSKTGGSSRPASPSKLGTSLRPPSPSNVRTSLRPASPNKMGTSLVSEKATPSGGTGRIASPSRVRNAIAGAFANTVTGMPSVLCFGSDVRRVRVGDSRLGDAHLLRILHNRHLQWRFVNARSESSLFIQKVNAESMGWNRKALVDFTSVGQRMEPRFQRMRFDAVSAMAHSVDIEREYGCSLKSSRTLYNAWKATSDLRETVSAKRIELQLLKQNLKLVSILKGQMVYLEEWAFMVKDHCSSLSGAMESLKASTIRLPLIGGAKADIQDMKDAICSAADVMHAMASSICSLLEKRAMSYWLREAERLCSNLQSGGRGAEARTQIKFEGVV
ncbi:Protein SNOWY COTYLEDON 3 [Bienertia sinuspersici]